MPESWLIRAEAQRMMLRFVYYEDIYGRRHWLLSSPAQLTAQERRNTPLLFTGRARYRQGDSILPAFIFDKMRILMMRMNFFDHRPF